MNTKPLISARVRLGFLALLGVWAATLAGCGGGGGGEAAAPPPPAATSPQVTMTVSNGAGGSGDLVLTLDATRTPISTANFLAYVNAGFYNGTVIHRRSPGFVLQGGGYAGPLATNNSNPVLKPTNAAIALEVGKGLSNLRLSIAMARTDDPNSATSQFFINLTNNTGLDTQGGGYAVFGSITTGEAVVTAMTVASCSAWPGVLGSGECLPVPNITITRAVQTR